MAAAADLRVEMSVVSLAGNVVASLAVHPSETWTAVKRQVAAVAGTPVERQELVWEGRTVENQKTVNESLGLKGDSTLPMASMTLVVKAAREEDEQALVMAVREGRWRNVRELLAAGVEANVTGEHGQRPLHMALDRGEPALMTCAAVLEGRADPNLANGSGCAPLMLAAQAGHEQLVRLLLNHDADVNAADGEYTPLMAAAQVGHAKVVRLLLAEGVDVNAADDNGWSALVFAASRNEVDVAQALLEAGACTVVDGGAAALQVATDFGKFAAAELLREVGAVEP